MLEFIIEMIFEIIAWFFVEVIFGGIKKIYFLIKEVFFR